LFMSTCRGIGFALLASLLAACGTLLPSTESGLRRDDLAAFSLQGRFSLRQGEQNYSGRLTWRHDGPDNELLLASPFGQGVAEISTSAQGAKLTTSNGETHVAADAESLIQRFLGYPLPLTKLVDWLRGRSGTGDVVTPDHVGRPLRLRQFPWQIEYGYDSDDAGALPGRIFAVRLDSEETIELRLRIDEWRQQRRGP